MSKKFVTLPIGNVDMFSALAEIAWSVEPNQNQNKEMFFEEVLQQLGTDAFLYSFTPSGEIGSGENGVMDNPSTPRVSQSFYDGISSLVGEDGKVTKILNAKISSEAVGKNRMMRFKGSIINLVQLYIEAELNMRSRDKDSRKEKVARRKRRDKGEDVKIPQRERVTDFNYKKRTTESDGEWEKYLVQVEENRYIRLFVATIFFKTISDLFSVKTNDLYKTMKSMNILDIEGKSDKLKMKIMKQSPTRASQTQLVLLK